MFLKGYVHHEQLPPTGEASRFVFRYFIVYRLFPIQPSSERLLVGVEPTTSSLPRKRSTTELQQRQHLGAKYHPDTALCMQAIRDQLPLG